MADRRVTVLFEAVIQNYKRSLEDASQSTRKMGDETEKVKKSSKELAREAEQAAQRQKDAWQEVGTGATVAGAAVVAGVGVAVKKYADFDKAMSSVQAATHETTENMELLREAAIRTGADTAFSAEEAAQGIEELAKAGVSVQDILGGGLDGALALAAAGELAVADAAEIASSAMTQFNLKGGEVTHIADLLAAGAGKAQGGVQDLGAALSQAGLVASSTGLSIEETVGGLTAFASAGLMGSDAGTSFKSMLQRLTPQSKEAQKQFDELGISAYDANGEFIGLSEFAGVLQEKMAGLTPQARNAAMGIMFGSDAVRASNILYNEGAEGIQKWIEQVDDAGYAAETASIMQDNLAGDLEKLGGAFDTVFIQSGGSANDALRLLVQTAEGFVDIIGKIPAPVLGVGTILAGVAGGGALVAGGLIKAIPKINDAAQAFKDLGFNAEKTDRISRRAGKTVVGIGKAAGIATIGVGALTTAITFHNKSLEAAKGPGQFALQLEKIAAGGATVNSIFQNLDFGDSTAYEDRIHGIGDALKELNRGGLDHLGADLGARNHVAILRENVAGLDSALASAVSSGNAEKAAVAWDQVTQAARDQGMPLEKLEGLFPGYIDSLASVEAESAGAASNSAEVASALEEVGVTADGAVASMSEFLDILFATGMATMSTREAAAAYEEQLDETYKAAEKIAEGELGNALNKAKDDFDLTTEAGRLAQESFHDLAQGGMSEVKAMAEEGLGQDEIQAKLEGTYSDLIAAGEAFGLSAEAAEALAREVLGVPDDVSIKSWMDEQAKKTAEQTKTAVENIPSRKDVKIVQTFETHGSPYAPMNPIMKQRQQSSPDNAPIAGRFGKKASGGRLPYTGLGTDMMLGVSSYGMPLVRVDDGEWVVRESSASKYNGVLSAINSDSPSVQHLAGLAGGGVAGGRSFAPVAGGGITFQIYGATDANAVAKAVEDKMVGRFAKVGTRI